MLTKCECITNRLLLILKVIYFCYYFSRVCKPFLKATENDIKNFYNSIADDFADLVQYNEDNRMSADPKYKNITINTVIMYYYFFEEH